MAPRKKKRKKSTRGKIQCAICSNYYHVISPTHLKLKHQLMTAEYKKLYPHAPMVSDKQKATLIKGNQAQLKKLKKNQIDIECEWCATVFKDIPSSERRFCSRECKNKAQKGIGLPNSVKQKIAESLRIKKEKQKHPWEVYTSENEVQPWLMEIYEELKSSYDDIRLLHQMQNGYVMDLALPDKKIGVCFTKGWQARPSINPIDASNEGWECCDVFSQEPKKAANILKGHIGKVGRCPSIKTNDFRYVSAFYEQYKTSMGIII